MDTEIAHQVGSQSIRSPFAVNDVPICIDIETVSFVSPAKFLQTPLGFFNGLDPLLSLVVAAAKNICKRGEPWIKLDNAFIASVSLPCHERALTRAISRDWIGLRLSHDQVLTYVCIRIKLFLQR